MELEEFQKILDSSKEIILKINYEKWIPIIDFVGVIDPEKRDWLIDYFQQLEDNGTERQNIEVYEFHQKLIDGISEQVPRKYLNTINPLSLPISQLFEKIAEENKMDVQDVMMWYDKRSGVLEIITRNNPSAIIGKITVNDL